MIKILKLRISEADRLNERGDKTMETALIVEDHPEQAELVARILRLREYEPIIAEDGETGLRLRARAGPRRGAS